MANPRSATVLKMLGGTARRDRMRDEARVTPPAALAGPPPGVVMTERELAVFDWYRETAVLAAVHRQVDAMLLVQIARIVVQIEDVHSKTVQYGAVMHSPRSGMPVSTPFARQERQFIEQLRALHGELGLTPQARLRIAPPMDTRSSEDSEWDAIDRVP
jgi:hypothetical protein